MNTRPLSGWADLARVLAEQDEADWDQLAEALGFGRKITDEASTKKQKFKESQSTAQSPGDGRSEHQDLAWHEAIFYAPCRYRQQSAPPPLTVSKPGDPAKPLTSIPAWPLRPNGPLGDLALRDARSLAQWLEATLATMQESRTIDVPGLVGDLAKGEPLRAIPYEQRKSNAVSIKVVLDRNPHLVPIWADQALVSSVLNRVAPNARIERLVTDSARGACVACADPLQREVWPQSADEVWLALTDFGALGGARSDLRFWNALGRALGPGRALALCPVEPERLNPSVLTHWSVSRWDDRTVAADEVEVRDTAAALLKYLSLCLCFSPGLLRVLRLAVFPNSDPEVELAVWNDPDVARLSDSLSTVSAERAAAELAALRLENDPRIRLTEALAAIRLWRGQEEAEDRWFPEILNLPAALQGALPYPEELDHARDYFTSISAKYQRAGTLPLGEKAYLSQIADRAVSAWREDSFANAVWPVKMDQPGFVPPRSPGSMPLLQPPLGRLRLGQSGDRLLAEAGESQSTFLAEMLSDDGILEINALEPSLPPARTFFRDRLSDGSEGPEMVSIPTGSFLMGSPTDEKGRDQNEGPQYSVEITEPFALARNPVTFDEYDAFCAATKRKKPDDLGWGRGRRPVINVDWQDAQAYCDWLSAATGETYRLPSEAEWEYACRAGTETPYWWGKKWDPKRANAANANRKTTEVGTYKANEWGLHDTHGNVWEWCADTWKSDYITPRTQAAFSDSGDARVIRGGSWISIARYCRAAYRLDWLPEFRVGGLGFRPARGQAAGAQAGKPESAERSGLRAGKAGKAEPPAGPGEGPSRQGRDVATISRLRVLRGGSASVVFPAAPFVIRTDRAELVIQRITRSELGKWTSGMGRDRFGLWADFALDEISQRLRFCPPGQFLMGSPEAEPGRYDDEGPQTEVTFEQGFWLFDTPVTQALYQHVTGENPSRFVSPDRPVEQVDFRQAGGFIEKLNRRLPGIDLRLPSEAEWEYACRAGTTTATYAGPMEILGENNAPILDRIAWYGGNSGVDFDLEDGEKSSDWPEKQVDHTKAGTRPVKHKRPNPWGLYDTLGNVWEWCEDLWADSHKGASAAGLPRQVSKQAGDARVVRGGSWIDYARGCRAAYRSVGHPGLRDGHLGFRPARGQASGAQAGKPDSAERLGLRSGDGRVAEPRPEQSEAPPRQGRGKSSARGGDAPSRPKDGA